MELERINSILLGTSLGLVSSGFFRHIRTNTSNIKLDACSNTQVSIGLFSSGLAGALIVYRAIRN